jgi:hypothetical protein
MDPCLEGSTFVKRLRRLSGRAWIDSNRIAELERQVKSLRRQIYVVAIGTLIMAIGISVTLAMILVRLPLHSLDKVFQLH